MVDLHRGLNAAFSDSLFVVPLQLLPATEEDLRDRFPFKRYFLSCFEPFVDNAFVLARYFLTACR